MRLIHFSDPHLTDLRGIPVKGLSAKRYLGRLSWHRRRFRHLRSNLDALCAAIMDLQPDLIVLTGGPDPHRPAGRIGTSGGLAAQPRPAGPDFGDAGQP